MDVTQSSTEQSPSEQSPPERSPPEHQHHFLSAGNLIAIEAISGEDARRNEKFDIGGEDARNEKSDGYKGKICKEPVMGLMVRFAVSVLNSALLLARSGVFASNKEPVVGMRTGSGL